MRTFTANIFHPNFDPILGTLYDTPFPDKQEDDGIQELFLNNDFQT